MLDIGALEVSISRSGSDCWRYCYYRILIQIHHIFMKIASSNNSLGDNGCFAIFALLFGQTEGILEKYCILVQSEGLYWLTL